ncbi:MAG: LytR C-terminal domain-containing protein [Gemmatimonadetes bacterium]|nr:LytR C-terminal domain-containing protein [Gemmatimonadota bacterium]
MTRLEGVALAFTLVLVAIGFGSLVAGLGGSQEVRPPTPGESANAPHVRVEVLNAANVPGLAREGTRRLREAGFDVVYFGNAGGEPQGESVVLDRAGELETARQVARVLGIAQVRSAPNKELYLDVSVLLGRDWRAEKASAR